MVPVYMKTGGIARHHLALACVFVFIFSNYSKALKPRSSGRFETKDILVVLAQQDV